MLEPPAPSRATTQLPCLQIRRRGRQGVLILLIQAVEVALQEAQEGQKLQQISRRRLQTVEPHRMPRCPNGGEVASAPQNETVETIPFVGCIYWANGIHGLLRGKQNRPSTAVPHVEPTGMGQAICLVCYGRDLG